MNKTPRAVGDSFYRRPGVIVTVTSELSAEFAGTNLFDLIGWKPWRPSSTAAQQVNVDLGVGNETAPDAWGIVGANSNDQGAAYALRWSDTSITGPWTGLDSLTPGTNEDFLRSLDGSESHRYWSIRITGFSSTALVVSEVVIGEAVSFPLSIEWPGFDPNFEAPVTNFDRNAHGHIIGAQYDYSARPETWRIPLLPNSFLQDLTEFTGWRWLFENYIRPSRPVFFLWNADETSNAHQFEAIWGNGFDFRAPLRTACVDRPPASRYAFS